MGKTVEELEAEIALLRADNERLRKQPALTMVGTILQGGRASTIAGLEEMILQIGVKDTVGYVNAPMGRLMGIVDRKSALGTPLSEWDRGPLGEGALAALVQLGRASEEARTVERSCPGLPADRLPGVAADRPAGDPILAFTVEGKEGRVQIVAQDITKVRWLESTFARYVPPSVIARMQGMPVDDLLSVERRAISVLFVDMRGFTSLVQSEQPDVVRDTVNEFLGNMVACVESLEGTVQGFAGDEVMALFGAPMTQPDHALRALICAAEMQDAQRRWLAEREAAGKPARGCGVGIASGPAVVGNIGTPERMAYTAQGHTTNLAARLCSAAAAGEILTTPDTHAAALSAVKGYDGVIRVPRFRFVSRGRMDFKNVAEPVAIVAVTVKSDAG